MKRQHTYEELMGRKLNGLAAPEVTGLWEQMETILDKAMPQQAERKRRGAWWLHPNLLMAATLTLAFGGVYTFNYPKPPALQTENTRTQKELAGATALPAGNGAANKAETGNSVTARSEALSKTPGVPSLTVEPINLLAGNAPAPNRAVGNTGHFQKADGKPAVSSPGKAAAENDRTAMEQTTYLAMNRKGDLPLSSEQSDKGTGDEALSVRRTALLADVSTEKTVLPAITNGQDAKPLTPEDLQRMLSRKKWRRVRTDKGLVFGVELNYTVPVQGQRRSGLDRNGRENSWPDYIPSVYAQYHLGKSVYLQAEWQPVAAQYTRNDILYHTVEEPSPDEKEETIVRLNKLYYTSLPFSVHYKTPLKNVTVALGMQYSLLKKMILQDQAYYHVIGPGYWTVTERKNEVAVRDPQTVSDHNTGDVVDNVARSFRREDWRLLADAAYSFKGLSGGLRYTRGLQDNNNSSLTNLPVKGRNESLQFYLHVNLFDTRKK